MSLINEALKKAQRMRHEDVAGAPPAPGAAAPTSGEPYPAQPPLRRGKAPASQSLLLFGVGIPVLVILSVTVTWWLLRSDQAPAVATAPVPAPTAAPAPAVAPVVPAPAPEPVAIAIALPPIGQPAPVVPSETAPAPAPAPADSVPIAEPTLAAATEPAAETAVDPTSPGGTRPNPRVNAFLDTIRVSGIRASATDPRVSMNDRVFRLNDIVDRTLELRIIGIAPEGLTFIDPAGVVYKTQF